MNKEALTLALEEAEIGLANLTSYQSSGNSPTIHEYGQAARALVRVRAAKEALAQPEQESVAFIDMREWPPIRWREGIVRADVAPFDGQGLFFSPPQRKPLTNAQIESLFEDGLAFEHYTKIVRAIEAAHGIK